ncbi:F-box/LRR-repeat protein 12-like [Actinidia eriantha]|uniref:F-box/LRR-repeat protein 12-like n=1 Tax=Actinidia eriantha TaxID=165200 RepID=UPI00258C0A0A|nr:F-box/LRR-repeat protein 12-like [Actinidia eriantha]
MDLPVSVVSFEGCSQSLTHLEAESCKFEPEGVLGIVSGGGLEYLSVSCLSRCVHGDVLAAIGSGFSTRLRVLNFRLCRTIKDESILAIAKRCPLLEDWNLALRHKVKLLAWESISSNFCNLKRLHVNRCHNLCNLGLQAMRDGYRRLSILHINSCHRISSAAMEFKFQRTEAEIKEKKYCAWHLFRLFGYYRCKDNLR